MRSSWSALTNPEYIQARQAFVHKKKPTATPLHLMSPSHPQEIVSREQHNNGKSQAIAKLGGNAHLAAKMNGRKVSRNLLDGLKKKIKALKEMKGVAPKLAVVIVSGNSSSERYVRQKKKAADEVGIITETYRLDNIDDTEGLKEQLIACIKFLNKKQDVSGIMVQLPLPGVKKDEVLSAISPEKDVDGFAATNIGSLAATTGIGGDSNALIPCTAKGIMALLDHYSVPILSKRICIVGRSNIVGMPTQLCLMRQGATVTNCDINTIDVKRHVQEADIVIAAAGSPELIRADWIKPGAVVIDAGFHVQKDGDTERIVGDVEADADQVASLLTPVPGGVGPMTVAMLLHNTFLAQQRAKHE